MKAASASEILQELTALFPDFSPRLRQAARYVLDQPEDVAILTMRALAGNADVAPSTMVRLAQRAGFASYEEFRLPFEQAIRQRGSFSDRARSILLSAAESGTGAIIAEVACAGINNIEKAISADQAAELERAARLIGSARRVYVVATSALHHIAAYFFAVARLASDNMVLADPIGGPQIDDLNGIGKGDVLLSIAFEPYAQSNVATVDFAKQRKAKVIAITDSRASPIAAQAAALLLVPVAGPQFFPSQIGVVTLLEALIALVVADGGRKSLARIKMIEKYRRSADVYWRKGG